MATVYGNWGFGSSSSGWRAVLVYSTTDNGTTVTINTTLKIQVVSMSLGDSDVITGKTTIGNSTSTNKVEGPFYDGTETILTKSRTYTKTSSNQSVSISVWMNESMFPTAISQASATVTIPRMTYPVRYYANGGDSDSVPAAQTKVINTTLKLSSTIPTRAGFTFLGWNTNAKGTGTHYAPGSNYTGNAALNLYAMWLGVSVPSIECARTDSTGAEADEGTYGTVQASWQALGTVTASIAVTARNVTAESAITLDGDTSGSVAAGGSAYGNVSALFGGSLSTDTRYKITVTVTATTTYNGGSTVTKTATAYVTYAYITMDVRAGGHGVAFGKTANREGFDVAMSPIYFSQAPTHDTDLTSYSASSIITGNSGVATITGAAARRWGKVVQLSISWTNDSAITVPAGGNIQNVTVGTIAEGLRPAILTAAHSHGDSAGAAWYRVNTSGAVSLGAMEGTGAERTIAAGTTFNMLCTYILP